VRAVSARRLVIDAVLTLLGLLGSLGVFLFGMKIMSEGLQKVAGSKLKALLAKLTVNRFTAVLTGLVITVVVQSSSATTVMVVSFVSAGLMTLVQAIGVVMGANIGTTMTAWMVALLGFKVKVTAFALPAIGIGLPMSFLRGARVRQWGEVLIGFGLLFLGLDLIKDTIPKPTSPEELAWLQPLIGHGYLSVLIFVGLGIVFTLLLQSSSATTTLTLTLAAMGWIPYELALAMVLGENVGTTVTANLASIGTSTDAKRAARAHLIFNLVGVSWAFLLMDVYLVPVVDWIVPGDPRADLQSATLDERGRAVAAASVTIHLAAFHTLFNVTNTLVMLPLVGFLERTVRRLVPERKAKGEPVVRYMSTALIETPGLMLIQAGKEMQHMMDVVRRMFADAMQILTQPSTKLGKLVEDTLEREDLVDRMEQEVIKQLTLTARAATSANAERNISAMVQNVHRLERIADHCAVLVRIARRMYDAGQQLDEQDVADIRELGAQVDSALENVGLYMAGESSPRVTEEIEQRIDETRRQLRTRHIEEMKASPEALQRQLAFLDAITHLEEIGDRAAGIVRHAEMMKRL
jgi:phosphate:Na+ symporter